MKNTDRKRHWESAWSRKSLRETSWYQEVPALSLGMIERSGVAPGDPVIDVGGGASPLAGCLLALGFSDITVLDISAAAMTQARESLGKEAERVRWIEADVTDHDADRTYALWHDRAVFHFLTEPGDRKRYVEVLLASLRPGGTAIIATFAPGGPLRCSGLDIVQYDAAKLAAELGPELYLCEECSESHRTPGGSEQLFGYYRFQRRTQPE